MRIGIDIGGTFTDVFAVDGGQTFIAKVPSSYPDPSAVISSAVQAVLSKAGKAGDHVTALIHGTTVATNAVIERELAVVGLITTAGFRDVLAIGRQTRNTLYQLDFTPRWVPVARQRRLEVNERTDHAGRVLTAPDRDEVLDAAAELVAQGATAICVAFLHSYANDANEREAAAWIRQAHPELGVWTSASAVPEFREYERFSTAVVDAALGQTMTTYLGRFVDQSRSAGVIPEPYLMESSGGVVRMSEAAVRPTRTLLSGPAGGVLGAINLAQRHDRADLLTFDMGGTSADIGVIRGGAPEMVNIRHFEDLPVLGSTVALEAIGAGGGSIAWVDRGGRLQVGPRSAGSVPGPAAYRTGGTEATVTDAHVVLGTLPEAARLGNSFGVDRELAVAAVERSVGTPLNLDVISAAHAILDMVNTNMALAARRATVARGIDPRSLTLVAYGGAGPLHATALAAELGIDEVIIPPHPGMLSAMGLLVSDLRKEFMRSFVAELNPSTVNQLADTAKILMAEAAAWRDDQGETGSWTATLEAELRYRGQEHTLRAGLPDLPWDAHTLDLITDNFSELHENLNGYRVTGEDIEMTSLRVTCAIDVGGSDLQLQYASGSGLALSSSDTPVWWTPDHPVPTPVFSAPDLHREKWIDGPAVLLQEDSTCAVGPGYRFRTLSATGGVAIQRTP
ncbi:hydantoinase/oxoprolinase family protein [Amycolatopsis echigonensis]|uniref:Hydantoinase/oxoprolinase family protein n=1 Tax=Amycolatopsis echigonensis TaxID=2576905 RepID=A0A8E1W8Z9_9PSEU|nr:hydantoinase/oxoprolinase family protein [Amycolatopsis echigonensis]MBB2505684.1 hydantoinase/oxoprolinase family protein [Amycolatopsis echigonensis]